MKTNCYIGSYLREGTLYIDSMGSLTKVYNNGNKMDKNIYK